MEVVDQCYCPPEEADAGTEGRDGQTVKDCPPEMVYACGGDVNAERSCYAGSNKAGREQPLPLTQPNATLMRPLKRLTADCHGFRNVSLATKSGNFKLDSGPGIRCVMTLVSIKAQAEPRTCRREHVRSTQALLARVDSLYSREQQDDISSACADALSAGPRGTCRLAGRETKEREAGRTLNRRSVRRRRPRLREEQTRSAGGLGQQSGELKRSGFSREVNRGGRAKQSCKRLWVHTFRALRVVPAVRWSGAGRCGVSGGKVAWREREDEASRGQAVVGVLDMSQRAAGKLAPAPSTPAFVCALFGPCSYPDVSRATGPPVRDRVRTLGQAPSRAQRCQRLRAP